jgi:Putative restriction endonuclease
VRLQRMLTAFNAAGRLLVQVPVQVPDYDEPEPDLAVLRAPLGRRKPTAADCQLVIEVSDTTLGFDRQRKLPAYLRGGVPTVWIVNVPDQQVEEYRADRPSHRVYPHDDPLEVDGATVDLAALFEDLDDEAG